MVEFLRLKEWLRTFELYLNLLLSLPLFSFSTFLPQTSAFAKAPLSSPCYQSLLESAINRRGEFCICWYAYTYLLWLQAYEI